MNCNSTAAFTQYLQSVVKLDELQKMTDDLDKELEDSQRIMSEMKSIFDNIPNAENNTPQEHGLSRQDISQFIDANAPNVLMQDMANSTVDVDLDDIIASIKVHVEDLRKNFVLPSTQEERSNREFENLDLGGYASSLDQLSKRLENLKSNRDGEVPNRDEVLEAKLTQLCEDVNMFTKMVQAKTKLSESNKNWTPTQRANAGLEYDKLINKLVLDTNEVTFLLKKN